MSLLNTRFLGKNSFINEYPSVLDFYRYKGNHLKNKYYFDNSGDLEVSETVPGTPDGTINIRLDDKFSGGETVYSAGFDNLPYVDEQRNYLRLCSTNANASFSTPASSIAWDASGQQFLIVPVRSTGDAQSVTVRVQSGAGNYIEKTVTLPPVEGEYFNIIVDLLNDTQVGAFDPSAVDGLELIGVNAGQCFEASMAYAVFTLNEVIGRRLSYKATCIDNFDFTRNLETDDIKCGNVTVGKVATDDSVELTITIKEYSLDLFALGSATTVSKGTAFLPIAASEVIVNGGQVSLGADKIVDVFMKSDGTCIVPLEISDVSEIGVLDNNSFWYDSTTGIVYFGDSSLEGVSLIPCIKEEVIADCVEVQALEQGYKGALTVQRQARNGEIWSWVFTNVQIDSVGFAGFDDTGDDVDVTLTANPDNSGVLYRIYKR